MLGAGEIAGSNGDHESMVNRRAAPGNDHETLSSGAGVPGTEPAEFVDDKPGEGCGMREDASRELSAWDGFPEEHGGAVDSTPTHLAPWVWICSLLATYEDGTEALFTGWLASPRVVVTSGRCVYDRGAGWAQKVEVVRGLNPSISSRRRLASQELKCVKGWHARQDPSCDYGCVVLPGPGVRDAGQFGLASLPGTRPQDEVVNNAGFPEDRPGGSQRYNAFRIARADERFLSCDGDRYSAAAGSPLWLLLFRNGRPQRYVCGIVGSAAGDAGAVRLYREVFDNIQRWKAEAAGNGAAGATGGGLGAGGAGASAGGSAATAPAAGAGTP